MGIAKGLVVGLDRSVFRGLLAHTLLPKGGVVSCCVVEAPGGVFFEMLEILHADGQLTDPANRTHCRARTSRTSGVPQTCCSHQSDRTHLNDRLSSRCRRAADLA